MIRALLFLLAAPAAALYSVHFVPGAEKHSIMGKHGRFLDAPEAIHVADIYARLAGNAPLLNEGECCIPSRFFPIISFSPHEYTFRCDEFARP
jgi:hypothetical protein